uniref:FHA domain-containing protein n=1 Tax=Mycobacterium avium TaxID=1764 RepID=UPI000A870BCE
MTPPATPALTVRYDGAERTFAAGNDVVIGRDLRADLRVAHPLISRTHLIVRYEQGRWVAIDNGSLNGLYVNNRRVPMVDINDGTRVNMGNPDGPDHVGRVWAAASCSADSGACGGGRPGDESRCS